MTRLFRALTITAALFAMTSGLMANPQWIAAGNKALKARQYDLAVRYYGGALKKNPRSAAAAQGLGSAFYGKGDKARALKYYQYALKLQPGNARLKQTVQSLSGARKGGRNKNYQYGIRFYKRKNYAQAARYLGAAAKQQPSDPIIWQALGNAYYAGKQKDRAIQAWERHLALNPSNTQLRAYVDRLKGGGSKPSGTKSAAKEELPPGVPDHENMN